MIFAALLLLVCRQIREIFHNFRRSYDENGDRIEELTGDGDIEHFLPKEEARAQTREEIQIRRRYNKEIRRRSILIWAINIKFDCSLSVFRLLYNQETST